MTFPEFVDQHQDQVEAAVKNMVLHVLKVAYTTMYDEGFADGLAEGYEAAREDLEQRVGDETL